MVCGRCRGSGLGRYDQETNFYEDCPECNGSGDGPGVAEELEDVCDDLVHVRVRLTNRRYKL